MSFNVKVAGVILCLSAATKLPIENEELPQWHAWATCNSYDATEPKYEFRGVGTAEDIFSIFLMKLSFLPM